MKLTRRTFFSAVPGLALLAAAVPSFATPAVSGDEIVLWAVESWNDKTKRYEHRAVALSYYAALEWARTYMSSPIDYRIRQLKPMTCKVNGTWYPLQEETSYVR